MKKLILPAIFLFTPLVLFYSFLFTSNQVNAQVKKPLNCQELEKVLGSEECPQYVLKPDDLSLWCAQNFEDLVIIPPEGDTVALYKNRPADYTLLPETAPCPLKAKSEQNLKSRGFGDILIDLWAIDVINISNWPIPFVGTIGFDTATSPKQIQGITGIDIKKLLDREPSISPALEKEAWTSKTDEFNVPLKFKEPEKDQVRIVKGQGEQVPDDLWDELLIIGADEQQLAMARINTFPVKTTEKVIFQYTWSLDSGAVINVSPKTELKFLKPVLDKKTQALKRMIKLNKGEFEIKVKPISKNEKFGVQTDFLDLYVIGTHFWISHDPDKKYTLVGVYEGEVEVMRKDGKITTVTSDGDKPGIVVISQKLSVTKLVLVGLVLTTIIGVGIFILRKRFIGKGFSKKKR